MTDDQSGGRQRPSGGLTSAGVVVGRPFGIPVAVSPTWFLVAGLITYAFAPGIAARVPGLGGWSYVVAFAFAVLLYLSVLLHELSHSLLALRFGLPVRRITLHLLGGVSEIEGEPPTPGRDFLVAIAGPLVSLAVGGVGYLLTQALPPETVAYVLVGELTIANLLVGVFNLLPGLPLDGGRCVQAVVWKLTGDRLRGLRAAAWAGRVVAAVVLVVPFLLARWRGFTPDIVDFLWGALLASFIWAGATQALAVAKVRERLPTLSARTLTRRALPVAPGLPLSEALRRAIEAGAQALVVVDGDGRPVGLVNDAAVVATPEHRRPWVEVGTLARRIEPGLVLRSDLTGEDLVRAMGASPSPEYLVVDPAGLVYGVLMTEDVERAFAGAR